MAGEPAALSMGWSGRGRSGFLFEGLFVEVVFVDCYVAAWEGSGGVFR